MTVDPVPPLRPLNIAILLNSYRSPFIAEIRDSYIRSVAAVSPGSTLSFFYPADRPGDFPDPDLFDLIVVGGGNADPRKKHQWILRVHNFILDLVAHHPTKKLCGICWGHQTISMLFGAEIIDMEHPELGVTEAKLTPLGRRFFATGSSQNLDGPQSLRLQQHHRRAVGARPSGFYELLAGNQAFLSHNNYILTFQGHPEKDAQAAKLRVMDAARWYGTNMADQGTVQDLVRQMELEHDGAEIWKRILRWTNETQCESLERAFI